MRHIRKFQSAFAAIILGAFLTLFAGCAVLMPNYSKLGADATSEEKAAAIRQDIRVYLESKATQNTVKNGIVLAGKKLLKESKDPSAAADFANRTSRAAALFYSLADGQSITPDIINQVDLIFMFDDELIAQDFPYDDFASAVNTAWLIVYPKLAELQDLDLIKVYLQIVAEAFQEIYDSHQASVTESQ